MKKAYNKPMAKFVDFEYDTQVVAMSPGICDTELKITKQIPVGSSDDPCADTIKDTFELNPKSIFPPSCYSYTK